MGFRERVATLGLVGALVACATFATADSDFAAQRRQMVVEIAAMARTTAPEVGRDRFSDSVMQVMAKVPRHRFVPDGLAHAAYRNRPLPIGQGQTISQPYIVALSTDLIDPKPDHIVLEIGTGSGYQAAVLAELVKRVYSIEIVDALGREAAARLTALGYRNVDVRIGDGYQGWAEKAPFDGIIVTAAAQFVPEPLVQQLKPGGKMVIPVGAPQGEQELMLIEKAADGSMLTRLTLPVRFVPLTGKGAEERPRGR
jgi:protein-L-isoaspartate(D-aspartate) O-methyltransferase